MTAVVLRGDARRLPLPDACADLIVTSPPYFGLRSYTDACDQCAGEGRATRPDSHGLKVCPNGCESTARKRCHYCGESMLWPKRPDVPPGACQACNGTGQRHYGGQIGSEASPGEWVAALVACTAEWVRVLKPSGSMFINLGDKFATRYSSQRGGGRAGLNGDDDTRGRSGQNRTGAGEKSLLGLPWRYALACMDELGLILRRDIIWCLSGGARVYARTPTGERPVMLRDLVRSYQPENVQLWNGQWWTQVLGWNRSPDRDGALELELRTGERIGCTPGHRWPTQRGVIRADEIRIGDVIKTTRLPEPPYPADPAALEYADIGWLVGLYLAEGSRSEKTLQFAGHVRETERHKRLIRIAEAYHGHAAVYRTSENGVTCNVSGAILLGIIDHYVGRGRTARSKRLRMSVWQRHDGFLRAVTEGYLSGDGHYDAKNDRWRLGFGANDELAADLRTLAARLGAKISLRRHQHTYDGRMFPGWRGEWRWTRSAHRNAKQDGEVVAIRASRAREFYDVGMDGEPHLFALASGVLTHNSKPNGLPESVTDRCRSSHEYLFHFTVRPRYYAAVDEIREPSATAAHHAKYAGRYNGGWDQTRTGGPWNGHGELNPLGKLPGSVWEVPSQPLSVPAHLGVDHFAAFPMELPRRVILGWSPPGICTECGEGRRPVRGVDWSKVPHRIVEKRALTETEVVGWCARFATWCEAAGVTRADLDAAAGTSDMGGWWASRLPHRAAVPTPDQWMRLRAAFEPPAELDELVNLMRLVPVAEIEDGSGNILTGRHNRRAKSMTFGEYGAITGYACACPDDSAPVRPAVVVDPFGGTGTTALVAAAYGRTGVTVDRSADYCRLARWRTRDPGERARALGVPKPPPVPDGQGSLFDEDAQEAPL